MNEYIVTRKSDGVEVYRYCWTEPLDLGGFELATHDHIGTPLEDPLVTLPTRYGGRRILTKLEFRSLFSDATIKWIDRFEAQFEGYAYLTDAQKDDIRTSFKNYHEATEVDLDDPRWPPGLGLYVALGGMDAAEVTEVLRG